MLNAEKLLGKIVGEVMGSGGKKKKKKNNNLSSLGSGSALLTMIGLGVGAYEILKQKGQQQAGGMGQAPAPPGGGPFAAGGPPPPPPGTGATPPPPPSFSGAAPTPPSPVNTTPPLQRATGSLSGNALAIRLIQMMAAAAHADGVMDAEEERAVLDKLRGAELSQEEKMFLLHELHQPKSLDELVEGINDPTVAKTAYMLAVAAIDIDTEAERAWLNDLAQRLGISPSMQAFIEEQGQ
jgi:tellurite resistance protein